MNAEQNTLKSAVSHINVDPIIWMGLLAFVGILIAVVGYFLKRERDGTTAEIHEARTEAHNNHEALSRKVDRVESDVSEIKAQMGKFVTREESDRAHDRFIAEQKAERAELRGFLTAWLERIERALERKQDKGH